MRAILFPNSNIIFNVQAQDPAEPKPSYRPGDGGFSWVDWGAGIYTGWEVVENAGIALEEVTDLVTKPGRVCTNGNPVPLEQPDFVIGIQRLREVARAVQAAAREENQERVIELTTQLAEACYGCHQVHRIAPPGRREPLRPIGGRTMRGEKFLYLVAGILIGAVGFGCVSTQVETTAEGGGCRLGRADRRGPGRDPATGLAVQPGQRPRQRRHVGERLRR